MNRNLPADDDTSGPTPRSQRDDAAKDVRRVALVTGGSAGLGQVIASELIDEGYRVVIVGRSVDRLADARERLCRRVGRHRSADNAEPRVIDFACSVTVAEEVESLRQFLVERVGRLDVLVNVVGQSDRGLAIDLTSQQAHAALDVNVVSAMNCARILYPLLRQTRGHIINIGSLASKVSARYLGSYPLSKHALAGWTGQLRLEAKEHGIHVGLICPGPIRRDDAGERYEQLGGEGVPDHAKQPAGGARLKGLDPQSVARAVSRCIDRRRAEVILPRRVRLLIVLQSVSPGLADRLIVRMTSGKN